MKSIVTEGSNVEDAVQSALEKLELTQDQVDVEVLDEGSRGFLGIIGGKLARVRVNIKDTPEQVIRDFLNEVIEAMELEVDLKISFNEGYWYAEFLGDDVRYIIGRRGKTLNSLQLLVNMAVNKKLDEKVRVVLDAEGYRGRREETLRRLARKTADRVRRTSSDVMLEPMTPQERRIIHLELQNHKWVCTTSRGDDPYRKVVVCCKSKGE